MIRILHYGLSSNMGGIETYLNKIWTNIDREKFSFDFIDTNNEEPCFYKKFRKMGSKFYKITPRKVSLYKNKQDLKKLFEKEKFDILHCHLNTLSYITPIKIALKHGCKVIVHSRSSNVPKSLITKILHHLNSLFLPKDSILMLAVSDLAGNWLYGGNSKFEIINNGIDINKYKFNKEKRKKIRLKLKINDKFVVGHVGAFLQPKNHKFLIQIFEVLNKLNPNSVLLLIGEGPGKEEIRSLVKEKKLDDMVFFLGKREDISDLLSAMDYFLFPSIYEGFPNAVLEAQVSGLPILISDNITDEVVISKNCKKLSLKFDSDIWAKYILNNKKILNRENAGLLIEKAGFSVAGEIKKIENIYISIFNKG